MAKAINQVMLMGRLTRDPEERTTPSGKTVVSFSLAVDRPGEDAGADFFDVVAWEKLGELVVKYVGKGRKVLVQGRLRQDTWDDKDSGKKRSRVGVVATDVTFLDGPKDGAQGESKPRDAGSGANRDSLPTDEDMDKPIDLSEIPF